MDGREWSCDVTLSKHESGCMREIDTGDPREARHPEGKLYNGSFVQGVSVEMETKWLNSGYNMKKNPCHILHPLEIISK